MRMCQRLIIEPGLHRRTINQRCFSELRPNLGLTGGLYDVPINVMDWVQIGWMVIGVLLGATLVKRAFPFADRFGLRVRFWLRHGRKGKMILFVYSDSSNWKDYIETNVLPRIEAHATILNWSKRREWGSQMRLETRLFNQWAGPGEFVPVAILFSLIGNVKTFRLWQLPENTKHGKGRMSKEAEQALFETVKQFGW
jgi:hypothetical protein